jgi:hypothetical protein
MTNVKINAKTSVKTSMITVIEEGGSDGEDILEEDSTDSAKTMTNFVKFFFN